MTSTLDDHWRALVSTALLGTDRREPPPAPPGLLADLAADDIQRDAPGRVLQQAAAVTVARRGGLASSALPDDGRLSPPPSDGRPVTSPSATHLWQRMVAWWPVLEDEWLSAVVATGRRLSPELVVPLLARHRGNPSRHALVRVAAGPLAEWLIGWSSRLGPTSRRPVAPESLGVLPELSVTPDLVALLAVGPDEPLAPSGGALGELVGTLVIGPLHAGNFAAGHVPVLTNVMARIHPGVLPLIDDALREVLRSPTAHPAASAVASPLRSLVGLRRQLLADLGDHRVGDVPATMPQVPREEP
ncbi:MAG: hypothetical protein ACO3S5_00515 [Ilumatobacteraceae bacterium]